MALTSGQVTIGVVAVPLNATDTDTVSGMTLIVRNTDAVNRVALGGADVTTLIGFRLLAGAEKTIPLPAGERLYAIRTDAADVVVDVLRIGA
ncbi:MAG: hypothetical protein HYR62_01925 [Actinobacteria bacterium]|nr:hypothetical protein [Actinomycetota bacterium]MBI3687241.1 hypothetical protein [Actinomycetota bacterium]